MRLNTKVKEIRVEHGRATGVVLDDGTTLDADIVVSNADSAFTYKHLISEEHRPSWDDARVDKARYSMSLFVWYFGTDRKYDDVAHHTILLGPRYKGLLDDIFNKQAPRGGLQPLPAPPDLDGSKPGTRGLRRLLRAVSRAAPRQRRRLA